MRREDKRKPFYFILTLVYIFAYVAIQLFCIYKTTPEEVVFATLPGKDSHAHIILIAKITNILKNNGLSNIKGILRADLSYPSLYHFIIALPQIMLREPSYFIMRLVTLFFGVFLLILTYKFAKDYSRPDLGFLSCVTISLYPQFYNYFTVVTPHFFLMFVVLLSLYFLYKCRYFRIRKYSILFGLTFGISLFAKHEALVFIFPPLLYITFKALKNISKEILLNIFFSLTTFVILFSIFIFIYVVQSQQSIWLIHRMSLKENPMILNKGLFSLESLTFYWRNLFKVQLRKLFLALFVISIPLFLVNKKIKEKGLLLIYIFSPLFIFSFIPTKGEIYTLPILPAVSIVSVTSFSGLIKKKIIIPIFLLIFAYGTLSFKQSVIEEIGMSNRERYVNLHSSMETLDKIFEAFKKDKQRCQVWMLVNCNLGLSPALNYYKYVKRENEIIFFDLFSVSYPKGVIEIFKKTADYVLYCSDKEDLGWPTLEDVKRQYSRLSIRDKELKDGDFLRIVEAKQYFRKTKAFRGDYGESKFYFCIYQNTGYLNEQESGN